MKKNLKIKTQNSKVKTNKNWLFKVVFILFGFCVFYIIGKDLYYSAFFQKKERINVVSSEEQIGIYSLGLSDNVNYFTTLYPDLEATIPGGYGYYRLGALPKLANLEKKQDLFKKTYSMLTSSFIDFYFYPKAAIGETEIYFGKEQKGFFLPRFFLIFFGKSNALFFDRLYLYLNFLGKTKGQFKLITHLPTEKRSDRTVFSSKKFFDVFQGTFYKKTYRDEQRNVQIVYTKSDTTAKFLGQIIEGEGIRVVDITQSDKELTNCKVIEDKIKFTDTAKSVSNFFACDLVSGQTGPYNIIFKLGKVEEEWEVE